MLKSTFFLNSGAKILAAGDAARDSGDWKRARERYEDFLKANPSRSDIWVQLGHSRKESGDLQGAEAAYRHSLMLDNAVADTYLQLGHVLKIQDKVDEAIDAYSKALDLDPRLSAAKRELQSLGVTASATFTHTSRILIDLSDAFFYLRHHSTVSGIQRVQLGIAKSIIDITESGQEIAFLAERFDHSGYVEVDPTLISHLTNTLRRADVKLDDLRKVGERAACEGPDYEPVKGDVILVLGAFWVLPNVIERIIGLKSHGVRVGVMIHDIIPITHPEFCEKSLTDTFNLYIRSTMKIVDMIISISEYTQNEVKKLLSKENIPLPEMFVLHNAHVSFDVSASRRRAKASAEIEAIIEQRYALYVSTIEIRKNHTLLFRVWKELINEFGDRVPQLVFVGRPGWRVRDLMDQITGTDYLNGHITILHDIPDIDLETLYQHAEFTTFPSFVEGWGLPVGESLIFGRPCLASSSSSVPEVGGDFVDYIDPHDIGSAIAAFRRMITDHDYREKRATNIAKNFIPRTWAEVGSELLDRARELLAAPVADKEILFDKLTPILTAGKSHVVGHQNDRSAYINEGLGATVHFLFDEHWYPVEDFGRWLRGRSGSFRFRSPMGAPGPVRIILGLSTVGWYENSSLVISVGKNPFKSFVPPAGQDFEVIIETDVKEHVLSFTLSVHGPIAAGSDPRKELSVGVRTIAYAASHDMDARLSLLEEASKTRPSVFKLRSRANFP